MSLSNFTIDSKKAGMSFVRIWIHGVWATKRRIPYLTDSIRSRVFAHIVADGRSKGIAIDRVNGYVDHVHMIFNLISNQCVADIMHQVKGESSRWINENRLTDEPFTWQADYFVESVGERNLPALRNYVDNQVAHHMKVSFKEELKKLKAKCESGET